MIAADDSRSDFSARLKQALREKGMSDNSPTKLAKEFNSYSGCRITVHAARKWLVGEAIPTQEKLVSLAQMLNKDPQWLRYGGDRRMTHEVPVVATCDGAQEMNTLFIKMTPAVRKLMLSLAREVTA